MGNRSLLFGFILIVILVCNVFAAITPEESKGVEISAIYSSMAYPLCLILNPGVPLVHSQSGFPSGGSWIGAPSYISIGGTNAVDLNQTGIVFQVMGDEYIPKEDQVHGFSVFVTLNLVYLPGTTQCIIGSWDDAIPELRQWRLFINSVHQLVFELYDYETDAYVQCKSRCPIGVGWHTVGIVWDGTLGSYALSEEHCKIIYDGWVYAQSSYVPSSFRQVDDGDTELRFFHSLVNGIPYNFLSGTVFQVSIYDSQVSYYFAKEAWVMCRYLWGVVTGTPSPDQKLLMTPSEKCDCFDVDSMVLRSK